MSKKGSFHLPPAVTSVKSISPRSSRAKKGNTSNDLKAQVPILKEIYENPLDMSGKA
jgi:hypothetical protein